MGVLMYIDPKRCLQCGSRVRHTFAEEDIRDFRLSTDGTFSETNFWFCSIDCYKKCVGKYLDPRFHFDKVAEDDPEYQNQMGIWYDEFEKKEVFSIRFFTHLLLQKVFGSLGETT